MERSEMGERDKYGRQNAAARTTTAIATTVTALLSTTSPLLSMGGRDFFGTRLGCVYVGETINCTYPMDFRP
jgi:hypothetical protein